MVDGKIWEPLPVVAASRSRLQRQMARSEQIAGCLGSAGDKMTRHRLGFDNTCYKRGTETPFRKQQMYPATGLSNDANANAKLI